MGKNLWCLLFLLAALSAPAAAQERKFEPVDEGAKDASWVGFRNRLLTALDKRDRKFVLGVLDRNIRNSLDAPRGVAEFRKQWDFDANDGALWRELPAALFLGSAWLKSGKGPRQLCAPHLAAKWPDDLDPFDYGAITAKEVLVKSEPSTEAKTVATLSHSIVRVTDWEVADAVTQAKQIWVKVRLKSAEGFVPEEQIRSPVEHRACFVKTEHGWRMVAFVVGLER
ncbi:MAG: hypothetical protein FJY54_17700 [Betaproteobacteria bacterium]|nr:hypothetical protein [Betaproteobacteria bacterium]